MDATRGFAAAHGRGEVHVQAKLIAWQRVGSWVDAFDTCRGRGVLRRSVESFFHGSARTGLTKNGPIANTGRKWKLRPEDQRAVFNSITAEQPFAGPLDVHREHRAPAAGRRGGR